MISPRMCVLILQSDVKIVHLPPVAYGGVGEQPPSSKFQSFDKVKPDCKLSG